MKDAIREMQRQAGDLVIRDGIAERGLIIRHLVLPDSKGIIAQLQETLKYPMIDILVLLLQWEPHGERYYTGNALLNGSSPPM